MNDETLKLIKDYEERNDLDIYVMIFSDGSGSIYSYVEFHPHGYKELKEFNNLDELNEFLVNEYLKK